jgi:FMN phosphatase YigB (HAD superfamily)
MMAVTSTVSDNGASEVRVFQLDALLDRFRSQIRVLSLDCFDTVLWRRFASPTDVFFALQQTPAFRRRNLTAKLRARAESKARSLRRAHGVNGEVQLADIYRGAFADLTESEIDELSRAEVASEIDACYAYPETTRLILRAKAANLPVIIVSDTYLNESQMRELLCATLQLEAYQHIDRVFCSSEFGCAKGTGLFRHVLATLKLRPTDILHVGDSRPADLLAARAYGIHAANLVQHSARATEIIRLWDDAQLLLRPSVRDSEPLESPFRGVLARDAEPESPSRILGYFGTGPLLYGFARYVIDELNSLEQASKRPKALFLMRDAYLPHLACESLARTSVGQTANISRFVAYAATFRSKAEVQEYLAASAGSGRFDIMCRQLLLPTDVATRLTDAANLEEQPSLAFVRLVLEDAVLQIILDRSRSFRARFYRYLTDRAGVCPGDTLVFIDLGYEGTAQRLLESQLRNELGVSILGRYLLAVSTPGWEKSRKGLIDPTLCDDRALSILTNHISLLETLCTSDHGSVVDYTDSGDPVFDQSVIEPAQSSHVRLVQAETLHFVRDADAFFSDVGKAPTGESLRRAALAAIGRLLFLPTEPEVSYLEGFQLDMSMGTSDAFALFSRKKGLTGLRRRGLSFMERNLRNGRTNYPFELRSAGIELALASFTQQRCGLQLSHSDTTLRFEELPIVVMKSENAWRSVGRAKSTYDGYFALDVPLGNGELSLGVLFGAKYDWVQIDSVELIQTSAIYSNSESAYTRDASEAVQLDGISQHAPGLFECGSGAGFLMVNPNCVTKQGDGNVVCRIVFRPLVYCNG